jgi:hypothetical protein
MKTSILLLVSLLISSPVLAGQGPSRHGLTRSEISALVQAVQDEIYDYDYEENYFPEGGPVGDIVSDSRSRVPLYIDPVVKNGEGRVLYKLMPYGEVMRRFHVHSDGSIVLDGDPEIGFPASQPNRKTVYLKDNDVCAIKRTWVNSSFEIDLSPSSARIQDAVHRQKQRTGFSKWEFAHSNGGKKQ